MRTDQLVMEALKHKAPQLMAELQASGNLEEYVSNLTEEIPLEIGSLSMTIAKKQGYDQESDFAKRVGILNSATQVAREIVLAEMLEFPQEEQDEDIQNDDPEMPTDPFYQMQLEIQKELRNLEKIRQENMDRQKEETTKQASDSIGMPGQIPAVTSLRFPAEKLEAEIVRRLPNEARAEGQPILALIMGPICAGKTTLRRERFTHGYVLVDAAQLFIDLGGIDMDFPSVLEKPMEAIGGEVARRALLERMNIVTEFIGAKIEPVGELIDAMMAVGYHIEIIGVTCDLPTCIEREGHRLHDNVSAYYAEQYQMSWLLAAALEQIH